jgi:transcriptional antiterminator
MERNYYRLYSLFKSSNKSLTKFAKEVGIPKSELSVAFRSIEQTLEECQQYLELKRKQGGVLGFFRSLIGG